MSAPPLIRFVEERRVSVARDAAAVRQVLDADPVGSCMVASRVAEHGVDPSAIGGELWTRGRAIDSLCYAGAVASAINGWRSRTSRAGPQVFSSLRHIGSTSSARPTNDEHRRAELTALSANA